MAGLSAGKGSRVSGGTAGDATSGGNTNVSFGGFNVPRQNKNEKFYIGGALLLGFVFLLKRKK